MIGFVKDQHVYIKCAKNGCSTYSTFLARHGWAEINLFENNLDLNSMILWGHITDPHQRHTKGVAQYITDNENIDINDPVIGRMLVSAVFDEHTYSLSMMLSTLWHLNICWIPLDTEITWWHPYPKSQQQLSGDDLTNLWFLEQGLDLKITLQDRRNVGNIRDLYESINHYKEKYNLNYQKLVKNFLEPDLILYNRTVDYFRKKYQ